MNNLSVQPAWCTALPLQQQSVLLLAARGPDGIAKHHPCKNVVRAYRGTVLMAAARRRTLEFGERADTFMSLDRFGDRALWGEDVKWFFAHVDELPHHYTMHLAHGAQILAYKHPELEFRNRWWQFYSTFCRDAHLNIETEAEMDLRLNDVFDD